MRIGVFGGTFDPIHLAHLIVAEWAQECFALTRVLFVPAGSPPHKETTQLSPREHRWEMVRRAVADHPSFAGCDLEIRRNGVSFTIDTLRALRRASSDEFYLIIGEDSLRDMQHWKDPEYILTECTVVVAQRPMEPAPLDSAFADRVRIFPSPALDISSTMIRQRVREGRSIRYLVPPIVEAYIRQTGLYRDM